MTHYKYILLSLIYFWLFSESSGAQDYREEKKISKAFKISASGTLELSNKYGSIYISTWDKDSVKIDLDFVIAEKNENRFNKTKSSVSFDFSGNELYRSVKTQYSNGYSGIFKDIKEATNLLASSEEQTHVDYYISIPDYINLKIENKYGNIILPSLQGDVNISLANGNFQCRELHGNAQLELSFGNAIIKQIEQGHISLNFMETRISEAHNITLESKSSDVSIDNVNLIKLDARRGELEIKKLNYIFGEANFCEMSFSDVETEVSLNLKYGIIKRMQCGVDFKNIKISAQNADVNISLPEDVAFSIQSNYLKANINSLKDIKWQEPNFIDDKGTQSKKGHYKSESSKKNIVIDITNADLLID